MNTVFFFWNVIKRLTIISLAIMFLFPVKAFSQKEWLEKETDNFKIIYKSNHGFLSDYLLNCAEKSFSVLEKIFNYRPSEKIILNTFDMYDYGFGESTSIPQNYIHIEIEPFEPGYENVPYNERFQWVINHELVHIFYNDQANKGEHTARAVFSKTAPEQQQPLTVFFSLLTNYNRYSPVWLQESIAVYLETWLSGGFGRTLGSFDEMFFRSLTYENKNFLPLKEIDSLIPNSSFLLDMDYYLYGSRFATFLAVKYGNEKFLNWFKNDNSGIYSNYSERFSACFGIPLPEAWNEFISFEKKFQNKNIEKLKGEPVTLTEPLSNSAFGWVSQPFFDYKTGNVYFSYHAADKLASICRLDLKTKTYTDLYSLPTPSLNQVSSTAFDDDKGIYFFTTNNNQLYRDVYTLDMRNEKAAILFEDERVGNLTVSNSRKTLWGIRHNGGQASVVFSELPYNKFVTLRTFPIGEEVYGLSVSPSGNYLAVVMHKSSGIQQLQLVNLLNLDDVKIIYTDGNPENPSWSRDEKRIYFNSYANGVSNLFLYSVEKSSVKVLTHTIKGFFKPIEIDENNIFAFEFTSDGFMPVKIQPDTIKRLPAIEYLGQRIFENNKEIKDYLVNISNVNKLGKIDSEPYNSWGNVKIQTFIPVISGFQSSLVAGIYSRLADPLLYHDFSIETGYSINSDNTMLPKFHLNAKYEYKKELTLGFEHNASDFYDLFNTRKRGMVGNKYYIGYDHYYIYDNPLKVKQSTEIALYEGIRWFSDNIVHVSQPDFIVAQTSLSSKNMRRSIGSVDYEKGDEFTASLVFFGSNINSPRVSAQVFGEWNKLFTWLMPHNVASYRMTLGYRFRNEEHFQSKFFFGGFGNRELENSGARQYRRSFMFPGLPIYDLSCDQFAKIALENVFPPVKMGNIGLENQLISYFDLSIFSQSLFSNSERSRFWVNLGAQINVVFNHWYNLESTLSFGAAKVCSNKENIFDWFVSLKLLKN